MQTIVGRFRAQDNLDLQGHHLVDWRYLGDIPRGGAAIGQALVWNGTSWEPGDVAAETAATTWGDVENKPTTFTPAEHTHLLTQVTDYIPPTAGSNITLTANLTISTTGVLTGLTAGTNVSTNGSTVSVVDAPTFAGTVSTNNLSATSGSTISVNDKIESGDTITASTFISAYTRWPIGTTGTQNNAYLTHNVTFNNFDLSVISGYYFDGVYTNPSGVTSLATVYAYRAEMELLGAGNNFSKLYLFHGTLDTNKKPITNVPFLIENVDPATSQSYTNGFMRVNAKGGSSGTEVCAIYSTATATGSCDAVGYRGYATGGVGCTGEMIGVQGYVTDNRTTYGFAIGVDGLPAGGVGDKNLVMGVRSTRHLLVRSGSIFCTSGTGTAPAALSPTHVQANTNKGELFIEGITEFDDEVFHDGNVAYSVSHVTASDSPYTISDNACLFVDTTSGAVTVTLPTVSGLSGNREYTIKKQAVAGTVNISAAGSDTIDGGATYSLNSQYEFVRILADLTDDEWHIVG